MHGAGAKPRKAEGRGVFQRGDGRVLRQGRPCHGPLCGRVCGMAGRQGREHRAPCAHVSPHTSPHASGFAIAFALFKAPNQRPPVAHQLAAHAPAPGLAPVHEAARIEAVAPHGAVHFHLGKGGRAVAIGQGRSAVIPQCCKICGKKPAPALAGFGRFRRQEFRRERRAARLVGLGLASRGPGRLESGSIPRAGKRLTCSFGRGLWRVLPHGA